VAYQLADTIVAIASPPGGAARGIVRISGQQSITYVASLADSQLADQLAACRRAAVLTGVLKLPSLHASLPVDAYVWPTARSYTREPLVELHTIGSPPLLAAVVEALVAAGARLAEPGEFTLRAFLAGRLDLTQAEAVAAVIDAPDPAILRAALTQLAGGMAAPLTHMRGDLLDLLADLEAGLDFVDEPIEFISREESLARLSAAAAAVQTLSSQLDQRAEATDAPAVVLVGAPNAGKSSLFNALVGRTAAIVSPTAGTTRDWVRATLTIAGQTCELVDTAGTNPREALAPTVPGCNSVRAIEAGAARQAGEQLERADIAVLCLDSSQPLNNDDLQRLDEICAPASEASPARRWLLAITKSDLPQRCALPPTISAERVVPTSCVAQGGVDDLLTQLGEQIESLIGQRTTPVVAATAERCRASLHLATAALDRALDLATHAGGDELLALEIRLALAELGRVAGAVYTEDLLDRIFSRFCIGK
jgi:tRNA modification GTPase